MSRNCINSKTKPFYASTEPIPKGASKTKEGYAWQAMRGRCYNPNNKAYKYYGERGIGVCDRWRNSFNNFFSDMGKAPSKDHSIDRVDVNGDYSPENCRWATIKEQNRNKQETIYVFLEDKKIPLTEACEIYGVSYTYAVEWVNKGKCDFSFIMDKMNKLEKYRLENSKGNPNMFREVYQLSLVDGSFIKKWDSIKEATLNFSNKLSSHIPGVAKLNSAYINAYGFGWAYEGEVSQKAEEILNWRHTKSQKEGK